VVSGPAGLCAAATDNHKRAPRRLPQIRAVEFFCFIRTSTSMSCATARERLRPRLRWGQTSERCAWDEVPPGATADARPYVAILPRPAPAPPRGFLRNLRAVTILTSGCRQI